MVFLGSAISRVTMSNTKPPIVTLVFFVSLVTAGPTTLPPGAVGRESFPPHLRVSAETEEPLEWGGQVLGDYVLEPDVLNIHGSNVYKHEYLKYYLFSNEFGYLGQDLYRMWMVDVQMFK